MEFFDCLNNLYHKRFRYPTDQELSGKLWVMNRFLSMDVDLLECVAFVSKYFFTLKNRYYKLLYRIIPQSSSPRNKYLKIVPLFDEKLVDRYRMYYKLSSREIVDYLKILRSSMSLKELYDFVGLEYKDD